MLTRSDAIKAAAEYARLKGIAINLERELGGGQDGWVWESYRPSAVKVLERKHNYNIELICYQRFAAAGIQFIRGFRVPQLIDFNHDLQIVEMSIVNRPFLIDFAKSHIDNDPVFTEEQKQDWNNDGVERFGKMRWKEVRLVIASLKRFGIYYYDAQRGNIMFADTHYDED